MKRVGIVLGAVLLSAGLRAQSVDLAGPVDRYLSCIEDAEAAAMLTALLESKPAAPALLDVVRAAITPLDLETEDRIPYREQALAARIETPAGLSRDGPRAAVVLDVSAGHMKSWLGLDRAIRVTVPGLTPPEFSDEGRDAFLKILRWTAHRHHGDPDRLWMVGFSWAAHASWDTALHRPGWLAGIGGFGGGPRRVHFRLTRNLANVDVRAYCGEKDDPELVWNLREIERVAKTEKLRYALQLDPAAAHSMPLQGHEGFAAVVDEWRLPAPTMTDGRTDARLVADGPLVESPLFRVDAVDDDRVALPARIGVAASLTEDQKRRATIAKMAKSIAVLEWRIDRRGRDVVVSLKPSGVKAATLFLREDTFRPGDNVIVRRGTKTLHQGDVVVDARVVLEEARRTGERLRLVLGRIVLTDL